MSRYTQKKDHQIIDAHHHFWDPTNNLYQWIGKEHFAGDLKKISAPYLPCDFLNDARGGGQRNIVGSVHLEALWQGDPVDETHWLSSLPAVGGSAGGGGGGVLLPSACVAHVSLESPSAARTIARHAASPLVRGVRQTLNWHRTWPAATQCASSDLLDDAHWLNGYAALASHGLSFDLQVFPWQMPRAAAVARAHPRVPVAVNHCGMPLDKGQDARAEWERGMRALAAVPHVHVKISGLQMLDPEWTPASVRPLVQTAWRLFGADRCMFGSNFPVDKMAATYDDMFEALVGALDEMDPSDEDLEKFFYSNAKSFYRI